MLRGIIAYRVPAPGPVPPREDPMKFNIQIEVEPEELRRLAGLPDLEPVQDVLVDKLRQQVEAGLEGRLIATLVKQMVSGGVQSVEIYQKLLGDLLRRGRSGESPERSPAAATDPDPAEGRPGDPARRGPRPL